jgi:hypothetical protein
MFDDNDLSKEIIKLYEYTKSHFECSSVEDMGERGVTCIIDKIIFMWSVLHTHGTSPRLFYHQPEHHHYF